MPRGALPQLGMGRLPAGPRAELNLQTKPARRNYPLCSGPRERRPGELSLSDRRCSPDDVRLARKINFWKGIFHLTNLLEPGSWWALASAGWESLSLTKDGEDART